MVERLFKFRTTIEQTTTNPDWTTFVNSLRGVRKLLSLYFRFYKVTMFENTNATDERRM
jgi:hypothetical protein